RKSPPQELIDAEVPAWRFCRVFCCLCMSRESSQEYTRLHQKTKDAKMLATLADRRLESAGIPPESMTVYHLVGRDSANPDLPHRRSFSLDFAMVSPYAAVEILDLTEPQQVRFMKAYDIAKEVLRDLEIFPPKNNAELQRQAMEIDEFERGYP